MALSGAERVAKHRLRKRAEEFSSLYLKNANVVTAKEFIEAKEYEVGFSVNASPVTFDAGLINIFYDWLAEYESEDNLYVIDDLIEVWGVAQAEYESNFPE